MWVLTFIFGIIVGLGMDAKVKTDDFEFESKSIVDRLLYKNKQ